VPPAWHQDFTPRNIGDLKGFNWANSVLLNNIKSKGITDAIVFIKPGIQWWNYMVPANTMYFTDKDPIIFVKDLGDEENQKIIKQYEPSGRKLYRADYDTGEVEGYSNPMENE